jgi:hypothetical protein
MLNNDKLKCWIFQKSRLSVWLPEVLIFKINATKFKRKESPQIWPIWSFVLPMSPKEQILAIQEIAVAHVVWCYVSDSWSTMHLSPRQCVCGLAGAYQLRWEPTDNRTAQRVAMDSGKGTCWELHLQQGRIFFFFGYVRQWIWSRHLSEGITGSSPRLCIRFQTYKQTA